jgi:hypothetical protein
MRLDRRRKSMKPMLTAQEVFKRKARFNVRDAEWYETHVAGGCSLNLSRHMTRPVGVIGDDDDHHLDILDGSNDRLSIVGPGKDVPRSDPAADPFGLKFVNDGVGQNLICRRVAHKNVISHTGVSSSVARRTSS